MKPIKVVSWDVDGTLYSIGRMRWQLYRMLAQQVVRGRLGGFTELEELKRYRAGIDDARSNGGELAPGPSETDREGLLMIERRWYGPSIHRAGPGRV